MSVALSRALRWFPVRPAADADHDDRQRHENHARDGDPWPPARPSRTRAAGRYATRNLMCGGTGVVLIRGLAVDRMKLISRPHNVLADHRGGARTEVGRTDHGDDSAAIRTHRRDPPTVGRVRPRTHKGIRRGTYRKRTRCRGRGRLTQNGDHSQDGHRPERSHALSSIRMSDSFRVLMPSPTHHRVGRIAFTRATDWSIRAPLMCPLWTRPSMRSTVSVTMFGSNACWFAKTNKSTPASMARVTDCD